LKKMSGATIGMGPITADWFAKREYHLLWGDHLGQEMDLVPADVVYEPGSRVVLAGMPFEVVAIPGHAPDAVAYFQPDTKVVICADALWPGGDVGVLNTAMHGMGILDDAELAGQRLKALGATIALPGHGGMITDVAEALASLQRRLDWFRAEPVQMVKHIVRRLAMFCILRFQPIAREMLVQMVIQVPWLREYTSLWRPDWTAEQLFNYVLDEFMVRGLVYEEEGVLKCTVAV
jgi:glyoxylase-like metal-dependent hydrolase (beta-lactamase superfamily II)